tara:strand:- start:21 stop:311 length:291 start_codon:yes stop_codon:yes gene_type:complete
MFDMFIDVPNRTSSAIKKLSVDALSGEAIVTFTNGLEYLYENVSKRSIINVLFNPDVSLGFWVNNNCVNPERTRTLSYEKGKLEKVYEGAQLPTFA